MNNKNDRQKKILLPIVCYMFGDAVGVKLRQSRRSLVYHPQLVAVYHQHEVLYIIKPQVRCTLARDEIQPRRG